MSSSAYKDPQVTPLFACPNCKRLLSIVFDQCPHCRELIDLDQKILGTAMHVIITQACSLANTISTGDPGAIIILGITALVFLADMGWMSCISIINCLMALVAIIRWRRKYGWLNVHDKDLIAAKRTMKQSLRLWIALLFLESVLFVYACRS